MTYRAKKKSKKGTKILIWAMFGILLLSFILPVVWQFIATK